MSMPALLSHFGINTTRYVTTAGEIVFDGVTKTISGYSHATLGAVTPVAHHTFHGGEDQPADELSATVWWHSPEEIDRHVDAMKRSFPGFVHVPPDDDGAPSWIGEIDTGRGRFTIAIVLRRDRGLPSVRVVKGPRLGVTVGGRWVPSPHLYLNGNLCVADRDDWVPEEHTAATVTGWAAHWLAAYTEWRFKRTWPIDGAHPDAS